MGDVVTTGIGATFDSAFRHKYPTAQSSSTQNQTLTQTTTTQGQNTNLIEKSTSISSQNTYNASLNEFKPIETSNQVIIDAVTTPENTNRQKLFTASIIGASALAVAGTSLIIAKGKIPKTAIKYIETSINSLNKKIETITNRPQKESAQGLYLTILQKSTKGLMTLRGLIFNITPFKDVLFEKLVSQKLGLSKVCNGITSSFRKLSFATVKNNYKKANKNINNLTTLFTQTNQKLEAKVIKPVRPISSEEIEALNENIGKITATFNENFSPKKLEGRNQTISGICKDLNNRVYKKVYGNFKNFVQNMRSWGTFIPEEIIAKDKNKFAKNLEKKKNIITNTTQDKTKRIIQALSGIEININPTDKASIGVLNELKALTKNYLSASGSEDVQLRKAAQLKINKLLKTAPLVFKSDKYTQESSLQIISNLKELGEFFNTDKKGLIEELLSKYKEILPEEEYKNLKKAAKKASTKLNKAVNQEGGDYVDKVRDLTDGSALTDVAFSMILPVTSTAIAASSANTKEKKQSVALKYGIPIITGALTATIATIKLVAGGKCLGLGLLSTYLTNRVCSQIDMKLKSKSEKEKSLSESIS